MPFRLQVDRLEQGKKMGSSEEGVRVRERDYPENIMDASIIS